MIARHVAGVDHLEGLYRAADFGCRSGLDGVPDRDIGDERFGMMNFRVGSLRRNWNHAGDVKAIPGSFAKLQRLVTGMPKRQR